MSTASLSQILLHTIPRKVYLWLQGMGVNTNVPGQHQLGSAQLTWSFDRALEQGTIQLLEDGQVTFTIYWDLDFLAPAGTSAHPVPGAIENNLSWFIAQEQAIYRLLEDLDKTLREKRNQGW